MANTLDGGSFKEVWAKEANRYHAKKDVYRAIASARFEKDLKVGDQVNIPYHGSVYSEGYTRGTAVTPRDLTNANETLTVDVQRVVPFYIDDLDSLQSHIDNLKGYAKKATEALGNFIDGDVLGEVANADSSVDSGDLGGTDGNGIEVTTSNILSIFVKAQEKLGLLNVFNEGDFYAVISPRFKAKLLEYLAGKETALGDSTGKNGHIGKFYGFDLYESNNMYFTADLQMGTNPTGDDTITINGVTLTYKASLSNDGEIHICDSASNNVTNLTNALNNPTTDISETSSTGYQAWDIDDLAGAWNGLSATDNTTYVTIKLEGHGWVTVSETLTDSDDVWTSAKQVEHQMFGKKGAVDIVVQQNPKVEVKDVSDKIGKNIIPWSLHGLKTTDAGDAELVDVQCTWA